MRGVSTRLALHVGNVPFEDERVSYKSVHDPGETWLTMKKTMPFRQMPVMTINDPLKAALVDQVVLHIDDMNMAIFPSIIERDNNKKTLCAKTSLKEVPRNAQRPRQSAGETQCWQMSDLWNGIPTNMADKYTCVHRVYEAVRTHPKVAKWELAHKK
ncbi:hypothetical protein BASA82_001243 [Batrachochytrium salamandrivorans]|nr:hypothetical protein BASA82_001243 [Batrachochytrium salamandrivorans]